MLEIILKGIIIGIFISAPMGPIGVLVIQRTLSKGRNHGLISGLGATFSDLLYAAITVMGLGFVMDFITAHESIFKFLGSILLLIFGIFVFRSKPNLKIKDDSKRGIRTYWQDFVTAFLLTLLNPLIIFMLIALFTRFNFFQDEYTIYQYIAGYGAIGGGALIWWLTITYLFGKLRNKFNVKGLHLINKIIGTILSLISVIGIVIGIVELVQLEKW